MHYQKQGILPKLLKLKIVLIENNIKPPSTSYHLLLLSLRPMKRLYIFLIFMTLLASCQQTDTLFESLKGEQTGIHFNNKIMESDTLNILNSEFIYNGGGVAIADLNGDGLQDLFFTGSQVDNKLYLNKGGMQFEDITLKAGVGKTNPGQWSSGINIIDINGDGRPDIYVCNTFQKNAGLRRNLLYINQGNDTNGVPLFKEKAHEYGLDDDSHSPNAQFFDYDNDGDLDVFLSVNWMDRPNPNAFREKKTDGSDPNCDRLLRNDWNDSLQHAVFSNVSLAAGLINDGYSHSALVTDFNEDGWLDIYVANDYVTNDLIYINNHDGTFTNKIAEIFKHQAGSAMGSDVADIDNDGKLDVFTTEMLPYYNKRKKLFLPPNNYAVYKNNDLYGYEYQYSRNVLQLNRGINPETGLPVYSDVSFLTGSQETEWSWTPLMADYDNDGDRDIFITNGFPRDVTDHDFGAFRGENGNLVAPMELQDRIPQIKVPKFAFRNDGNLQFSDQSKAWGVAIPAFSNGAVYGDLDNDGDLDLVINNIDDEALVFKNNLKNEKKDANFLRLNIEGKTPGVVAYGATATVYFAGKQQIAQVISARGYNSSSEKNLHFGLGTATTVDSVVVRWPAGRKSVLVNIAANQTVVVSEEKATLTTPAVLGTGLFRNLKTSNYGLSYVQNEDDFVDFDYQRTLPHKFSQFGPGLAVGDINGDGLDDIFQGGTGGADGAWFVQTAAGKFVQKASALKFNSRKLEEDLGVLLFDADGDGDNDLFIARGGAQNPLESPMYQDVLCVNDGKGGFKMDTLAIPRETNSGLAAKAADFDGDGDLDLFVGGSMVPRTYPKADRSFILRNDSKGKDQPRFTDVTKAVCPELEYPGMIFDALWTDFDNDNRPDLLLAGEWMPLTFYHNEGGTLKNVTRQTGIGDQVGWWSSLAPCDFDNDGDMDYMAGNYGENLYFQCHKNEPIAVYAKDFDKNGSMDPFISCFGQDSSGNRKEYFYPTRDDMVKQLISIRKKFFGYGSFGEATVQDVFSAEELKEAMIMKANCLSSSYVENLGNGKFKLTALPWEAQVAPVFGMLPYDMDADGFMDLLMVGNDYGMELLQGRADAFYGMVLKNDGKNNFRAIELNKSQFMVPYNARALTRVALAGNKEMILATQNRDDMRLFEPVKTVGKIIQLQPGEVKARITLKNGQTRLMEFYGGSSFVSQQSRTVTMDASVQRIWLLAGNGKVIREF
jgi:hypothetical protein